MRDIRFLVKDEKFVKIYLIKEDELFRSVLCIVKGELLEIDLETGNYIIDNDSLKTQEKYGKTYGEFKDVVAIIVAKSLSSGFFELKNFRLNKEFFKDKVKVSKSASNYVEERLKKI